jgi:hypothetical protein
MNVSHTYPGKLTEDLFVGSATVVPTTGPGNVTATQGGLLLLRGYLTASVLLITVRIFSAFIH